MNKKLKNIKRIFVRYRNPYQSLERRFRTCELKGKSLENDIISAGENPTLINILKYIRASGFRKLNMLDNNLLGLLDRFSDVEISEQELNECIEKLRKNFPQDIIDVSCDNRDKLKIQLKDRVIDAETLTHRYPKIAEYYPSALTLESRKGKCHQMSLAISQGLGDDCNVVTGSYYTVTPRARFLHSWVEEEIDNETYCYDFTYNIALKQKDYYKLFHVIPYEKISPAQFREDRELLARLVGKSELYSKLYLSSREEALDIAKNLPKIDSTEYTKEK